MICTSEINNHCTDLECDNVLILMDLFDLVDCATAFKIDNIPRTFSTDE